MFTRAFTSEGRSKGFTLVELAVVLTIVTVLIMISVIATKWMHDRAYVAQLMADAHNIKIAVGRFQQDVGVFPPAVSTGVDPGLADKMGWMGGGHSSQWESLDLTGWKGPYMRNWPRNPWGGEYSWVILDPGVTDLGISGGGIYLVLKPGSWGANNGMPKLDFEHMLEKQGLDSSPWPNCIAVRLGGATP